MYKKILIPLDCSRVDDVIIEHILKMCSYFRPEIILLRVNHIHTRDGLKFIEKEAEEYMETMKEKFTSIGIKTEIVIEYGNPEDIIPKVAEENQCDLVALATHGHKNIMDFILGSVAEKIRHRISIPLLLIKYNK